jgi:DNA polymerase-3 subunit delta
MSIVKPGDVARFLDRGWKTFSVVLVHGSDEGLVRETADQLIVRAAGPDPDPMNLVQIDGEAIAQDPPRLVDELRTFGLFGGSRVVHVRGAAKVPLGVLEAVFEEPPQGAFLLLEAGELKAGAGIRALAEKTSSAASIACYADSQQAVQRLIETVLTSHGLRVSPEARELLIGTLGGDRALTRNELEKLALYAWGQETIDAEMVTAVVSDAARHEVSALIDRAFAGEVAEIETEANRLFAGGANPASVLSQTLSHILLLRRVVRGGGEAALRQSRTHFSRISLVMRASGLWSEARLERALRHVSDAVLQSRRVARLSEAITIRALWAVSRMARNDPA